MSVVILGGNECMERRYKDLCQSYKCSAKVFTPTRIERCHTSSLSALRNILEKHVG